MEKLKNVFENENLNLKTNFKISLKSARINANLTQQEVANKIQVSKHTIINWENKKTKVPYTSKIILSKLFNIPLCIIEF